MILLTNQAIFRTAFVMKIMKSRQTQILYINRILSTSISMRVHYDIRT